MLARVLALAVTAVVVCALACDRVPASSSATPAPQFAALVDEYLDQFARRHPSIAAGNGIHAHDGELEDFSAPAIAAEIDWLRGFRRRIDAVDPAALTPDERVDRRILQGVIDGWLLDLDTVRTWTRNPMIYASAISDGVHNLMTMESSPAASRARQATTKLTGGAAAARCGPREPSQPAAGVRRARAIVMFRGAADLMAHDLPLAFADVADRTASGRPDVCGQRCAPGHRRVRRGARVEGAAERDRMPTRSARRTSRRGIAPRS